MSDWLHWIGNSHYSISSFIKEAREMGVSRRVQPKMLRNMEWGDRVFCASRLPGYKSPVVFGYFILEEVMGVKIDEMPDDLKAKVKNVDPGPAIFLERGCGVLVVGAFYATTASVEELSEHAQDPMIVGKGLKVFPKPWPMLAGMPPFRGFRGFDAEGFFSDLQESEKKLLRGFYYA